MTPGRNRVRSKPYGKPVDFGSSEWELPDPPENPEFLEYPQEFQDQVDARIQEGIQRTRVLDNLQKHCTRMAHQDCAKRFRDAALARTSRDNANVALGYTIGERTDARRRRERRNGGAR